MKKAYVIAFVIAALPLAGCAIKFNKPIVPVISTGENIIGETITGEALTGTETPVISDSQMEEFTGEFDSGTVPMVEGSVTITTGENTVATRLKNVFKKRDEQPKDDTKLTEEDIDLMEQVIEKLQDLGN